ncbi:maleylpyruvate isomerase family mycothiol-dependent enzyme [Streptomyces sp. RY43-2]|uniref:Maleylpyruvate isomerase family mycothiol-dependent enzyme n=1 Tax=Streptomyces macrolidinus TaxID=2952607 RepID=A0ABT0ZH63_9ACTN|nr:maleylpyruvate isomerase family mycothiol-dependent enzyme [Streptomyces macrolidinus]MCN9242930.1 maleylpyruvate isomerase family mycothiol-dependent enzyme [Streptomyces macrolidinus]
MTQTPPFEELLSQIEERSAALLQVCDSADDLGSAVPSCPGWSLRDLLVHLTQAQRFWTAVVQAGPSEQPPGAPERSAELAAATEAFVGALREAGPEAGCWGWWAASGAPVTVGVAARRQVYEAAVHAYDAQLAVGSPQPVPSAIAVDGIDEFLTVLLGACGPWPHDPVRIALHTTEGPSWLLDLGPTGARVLDSPATADASLHGSASDVLLTLYGRLPLAGLRTEGADTILQHLLDWPPLSQAAD